MLSNGRHFRSQLKLLPRGVLVDSFRLCFTKKVTNDIQIPRRIERGPTDILRALSSTVGIDSTAFDYKYPDDPFFYTYSNHMKRKLALSMESGKNAAKWVVNEHPEFFQEPLSDPVVKAYIPKLDVDETEVTLSVLEEALVNNEVSKAIKIYKSLKEKNIEVPKNTKQILLELCCFFNCKDEEVFDLESKWFETINKKTFKKTWEKNNFAEALFADIGADCVLACSAIIVGRLKYYEAKSAMELFKKSCDKGMKFPVEVYNALFNRLWEFSKNSESRLNNIVDLVNKMKEDGIRPDFYTLNAILKDLSKFKMDPQVINFCSDIFSNFQKLRMKPSLASYFYLLKIFVNNNSEKKFLKYQIDKLMSELDEEHLLVRDEDDFSFFPFVMNLCRNLKYLKGGHAVNELLWKNDNMKFIQNEMSKTALFTDYFTLVFHVAAFEEAFATYRSICPAKFIPDDTLFYKIFDSLIINEGYKFLPEIWDDCHKSRYWISIMPKFLELIILYNGNEDEVLKTFSLMADVAYFNFNSDRSFSGKATIHPLAASFALVASYRSGEKEKVLTILKRMKEEMVFIQKEAVIEFCHWCISKKDFPLFMDGVKLLPEDPEMIKFVKDNLDELSDLPEDDLKWLKNLAEKEVKSKK